MGFTGITASRATEYIMKVLIAEDEVISRKALEKSIAEWGYSVTVSRNGEEAWNEIMKSLHSSDPSPSDVRLAVLDWEMPEINGVELCRRVREESMRISPKYIYIILLTGKDSQAEILSGLATGADDYMTKPFDPDELKIRLLNGERIIHLEDEKHQSIERDPLTHLWSRKRIMRLLEAELSRGNRDGHPTGILYMDAVCFPRIDILFGQSLCEKLIAKLARNVNAQLRRYDHIGRFTPSGFLIVLPHCDRDQVRSIGERLLECTEKTSILTEKEALTFNVKIGGISAEGDMTTTGCLQTCGQALQHAKMDVKSPSIIILPHLAEAATSKE